MATTEVVFFRVDPRDKRSLERLAKEEHMNVSTFVRRLVLPVIEKRGTIVASHAPRQGDEHR